MSSRTLPIAVKDELETIIRPINYAKASAVDTKLFTKLCKDMDFNDESLLFNTFTQWLSKFKLLTCMYEIKDELLLVF